MSKRITDFFSFEANKRQRTVQAQDEKDQKKAQSGVLTVEPHAQAKPSCSRSLNNDADRHESTSLAQNNASQKIKYVSQNESKVGMIDAEHTQAEDVEWYKGSKLNISWLLQTYSCFQKVKMGKSFGIKCTTCFKHIQEAQKFSKNGRVPIADGVRYDGQKELERIIDHLKTEAHKAADNLDKMQQKWMAQSDQHPWIRTLKSHNAEKVKLLIELAIDVYNDSRQLTLSAHSWPPRSLSKIHADTQVASFKDEGLDSQFSQLNPSSALLQYRNPVVYREMLDIVGTIVMAKVIEQLKKTDCFSLQVDGSVDKYGVDNKFITGSALRYEELKKICDQDKVSVYRFPAYFEVRFVEHLVNLSKAVWKNLPCMQKHWKLIIEKTDTTKVEKATARGFLRLWANDLTSLMMDLLRQFEKLQKDCQKSMIR
jgi:hypothetical protein